MAPLLTVENQAGQSIRFKGNTLVPFAQVWQLKPPWTKGGLIWNRPVSVVVRDAQNLETVVTIQDVTRQISWLLFGLSFASVMLAFLTRLKQRKWADRQKN